MSLDLECDANDGLEDAEKGAIKNHADRHGLSGLDSVLLDESWDEWDDDLIEAIGNLEVDIG